MEKAIYKITNKTNGRSYIGQSKDPESRFASHCYKSATHKSLIGDAIKKYGVNNFIFEVLEWTEEYNDREKYYIKELNTLAPNGYNIQEGGNLPPVFHGEDNPAAVITDELAYAIQQDLIDFKLEKREIIKKHQVTPDIVRHINEGGSWRRDHFNYPLRGPEKDLRKRKADRVKELLLTTDLTQKAIAAEVGWGRTAVTSINQGVNHHDPNLDYPLRGPKGTNPIKGRPIGQVDPETGEMIQEYVSIWEAVRKLPGLTPDMIRESITSGGVDPITETRWIDV